MTKVNLMIDNNDKQSTSRSFELPVIALFTLTLFALILIPAIH